MYLLLPVVAFAIDAAPEACPAEMALMSAGAYRMQKRAGQTKVDAFCIDRHEVTAEAHGACVSAGRCRQPGVYASRYCNAARSDRGAHPMNCVSHAEAEEFCSARGARLPTDAEWEWTARGGDAALAFPWGPRPPWDEPCWGRPRVREGTCAAGSSPRDRTPQGVRDMAGNVGEWTTRGGLAWLNGSSWFDMDDGYVRASLGGVAPYLPRTATIGFRCALSAKRAP